MNRTVRTGESDAARRAALDRLVANASPTNWREAAATVMGSLWRPGHGYASPNREVYPWQWLWDSCFHGIVWALLGDRRAVTELTTLFRLQGEDGMLPHVGYQADPEVGTAIWGRRGASTLTQPPMYGHALRLLADAGQEVGALLEPASRALRFFAERRRAAAGKGIVIVHPWESGADDSPRWDGWLEGPFDRSRWLERKLAMLASLDRSPAGSGLANPAFGVVAAGFNALVAFNCRELAAVTGEDTLLALADDLASGLEARFDPTAPTWSDRHSDGRPASAVRTLDALLPVLVVGDPDQLDRAYAALAGEDFLDTYGLRGVDRTEPLYRHDEYWRGGSWPPLTYLFWLAARRAKRSELARLLAARAERAAVASGFAEYLDPSTGAPLGAVPQGWACLAAVVACVERGAFGSDALFGSG